MRPVESYGSVAAKISWYFWAISARVKYRRQKGAMRGARQVKARPNRMVMVWLGTKGPNQKGCLAHNLYLPRSVPASLDIMMKITKGTKRSSDTMPRPRDCQPK